MKYFLCRFVPPGPDFLKTMTPEQKQLMKAHGDFCKRCLSGAALSRMGRWQIPLAAGACRCSKWLMKRRDDVRAIVAEDPMVKANVGAL